MAVFGPRRRVLVIPSATIGRVAARLESHGRIPRGYLGLGLRLVTTEGGRSGAMVMNVDPLGPGATAGIYQGDIVVDWKGLADYRRQARRLTEDAAPGPIRLALVIEDPALADRLAACLRACRVCGWWVRLRPPMSPWSLPSSRPRAISR